MIELHASRQIRNHRVAKIDVSARGPARLALADWLTVDPLSPVIAEGSLQRAPEPIGSEDGLDAGPPRPMISVQ